MDRKAALTATAVTGLSLIGGLVFCALLFVASKLLPGWSYYIILIGVVFALVWWVVYSTEHHRNRWDRSH